MGNIEETSWAPDSVGNVIVFSSSTIIPFSGYSQAVRGVPLVSHFGRVPSVGLPATETGKLLRLVVVSGCHRTCSMLHARSAAVCTDTDSISDMRVRFRRAVLYLKVSA
jgi:predicted benzoate:H+ symporter BenE